MQRREEIRVIAECPNDMHWAQEMRRAVAELLAHIDTLEQAAAERVIRDGSRGPTPGHAGEGSARVPPTPVTDAALVEVRSWIHAVGPVGAMVWVDPQEVLKVAGVRVLGEGMVAVDRAKLSRLLAEVDDVLDRYESGNPIQAGELYSAFEALRANQGGAAT